jgi:hypothetical protein
MARKIMAREGVPGFYRGFLPNALKNLPNKGASLSALICVLHSEGLIACSQSAPCRSWPAPGEDWLQGIKSQNTAAPSGL